MFFREQPRDSFIQHSTKKLIAGTLTLPQYSTGNF